MKAKQHCLFCCPETRYVRLLSWPLGVCREDLFESVRELLRAAFPGEKHSAVMIMCEVEARYGSGVIIGGLKIGE